MNVCWHYDCLCPFALPYKLDYPLHCIGTQEQCDKIESKKPIEVVEWIPNPYVT